MVEEYEIKRQMQERAERLARTGRVSSRERELLLAEALGGIKGALRAPADTERAIEILRGLWEALGWDWE